MDGSDGVSRNLPARDWEPARLCEALGAGTAARFGLDPADGGESDRFAWWIACGLRAADRRDTRVADALGSLRAAGWLEPSALVKAREAVAEALAAAGFREAPAVAARLARAAATLIERYEGSFEVLASGAPSFEELGERLVRLGPGFGPTTVLRFLRPLRDVWPAAEEAPLDPAAFAAAVHLGWLDAGDEPEMAPGTLRRRLRDGDDPPPLPHVEDALERLGRAACRRGDTRRCPLGGNCPAAD